LFLVRYSRFGPLQDGIERVFFCLEESMPISQHLLLQILPKAIEPNEKLISVRA